VKYRYVFLVFLFILLVPCFLNAGDGNYQNYIIGERAAGMGGAVTALCRSVDSCFYNPAGLAFAPGSTISLSASLYGFYHFESEDGWFPDEDVDIDSFITIPSTVGSIWKLSEDASIAVSAFIPDRSSSNDLEAFTTPGHYYKYNKDDQTLWLGPSIGYLLIPDLSVGVSVFGVYRTFSQFRDFFWGNYGYSLSEDIKYNDLSLLMVLGARYQLGERWSLGLRVQSPTVHLTGDGKYLLKDVSSTVTRASYVDSGETRNKLPTSLTAGIGYQVPRCYAFGFDISYHFPTSFNRFQGTDQFGTTWYYRLRREGTVDVNLGGEYYFLDRYALRLGFFTSRSSAPDADPTTSWYPAHINKYGITAGIARETEHTTLALGVNYVRGSGKAVGWKNTREMEVVDANESYLYVFLASSYLF